MGFFDEIRTLFSLVNDSFEQVAQEQQKKREKRENYIEGGSTIKTKYVESHNKNNIEDPNRIKTKTSLEEHRNKMRKKHEAEKESAENQCQLTDQNQEMKEGNLDEVVEDSKKLSSLENPMKIGARVMEGFAAIPEEEKYYYVIVAEEKFGEMVDSQMMILGGPILAEIETIEDFKLAEESHAHGEHEKSAELYYKCAHRGNRPAMNNLALAYQYGEGLPVDLFKAMRWYHNAADNGYADAQNNLALNYFEGVGTEQNIELGLKYIRLAKDSGHLGAITTLATIYLNGEIQNLDISKGKNYLKIAAKEGYEPAIEMLNQWGALP